jgi:hypothetical protein
MRALPRCGVPATVLALALAVAGAACGEDVDPRVGACADYCELIVRNCQGTVAQYTDGSTCMATCQAMPLGDPASPTGNTISCRTFQAAVAEDPTRGVCTAAGPGGDGTCGTNCESFCTAALELCPGEFASATECDQVCRGFSAAEVYDASDIAGDTFACRLYHLTAASTLPEVHCAHIGAVSPVCL